MATLIRISRYLEQKRGASLTGYGLIVGLIAIAAITAVTRVGTTVTELFGGVSSSLDGATSGSGGSGGGNGNGDEESFVEPDFLVTTSADQVCDPCTSLEDEAADGLSLREAIDLLNADVIPAGSVIGFDPALSGETLTLSNGALVIGDGDPVIDGTGHNITISGDDSSRIFEISNNATLRNLTVSNGYAGSGHPNHGGAISVLGGNVEIENLTITDSTAGYYGGGIHAGGAGTVLTINSSTVSNNSAPSAGGGISGDDGASITISNSTISNNEGGSGWAGGGIFAYNTNDVTITNTIISGNTASAGTFGGTGGIYLFDASADISDSTITLNDGGDAFWGGCGLGAFYWADPTMAVTLTNTNITNNSGACYGGGIMAYGAGLTLDINGGSISGNTGETPSGGGIYVGGEAIVDISGTVIDGNTAAPPSGSANGGGITLPFDSGGTVTLSNNVTITNNTLDDDGFGNGGAIFADGSSTSVTDDGSTVIEYNTEPQVHATNGGTITLLPSLAALVMTGATVMAAISGVAFV